MDGNKVDNIFSLLKKKSYFVCNFFFNFVVIFEFFSANSVIFWELKKIENRERKMGCLGAFHQNSSILNVLIISLGLLLIDIHFKHFTLLRIEHCYSFWVLSLCAFIFLVCLFWSLCILSHINFIWMCLCLLCLAFFLFVF